MTAKPASHSIHPASAVQGCLEACRRCEILVDRILGKDHSVATRTYVAVGRHLRHCLDHFVCLLRGIDSGVVDYDARDREERIETDPDSFLSALGGVADRLRAIEPGSLQRRVAVRQEAAPGDGPRLVDSNFERELVFCSSHTIHHIAVMTLLARSEGVEIPDQLGIAFSTATHLERTRGTAAVGSRTPN